jgi:uncharacterized membrane protein YbhN (UPF0104 family)
MPQRLYFKFKNIPPTTRKVGFFLLKIIVAVLVLFVLIRKLSIERLVDALIAADTRFIVAAFALLFLNMYLQFCKWRLVVYRENATVKKRHLLFSLLVGMALGLITPGRVGDFGRTFFVKDVDWAKLLGLLMIDKLITLCVLYFFGIIGLSHFISMRMHPFVWLPIFLMTLGLLSLFLLFLLRPMLLRTLLSRFHKSVARHSIVEKFLTGIEMATPGFTGRLLLLTITQTLTYCSQFVLLIFAFFKMPVLAGYLSTFAVMFTKSLLPISIGDLGIRESASVYFLGQFGAPDVAAFNASFLLFLINVLLPSLAGLALLLFRRQNIFTINGKKSPV